MRRGERENQKAKVELINHSAGGEKGQWVCVFVWDGRVVFAWSAPALWSRSRAEIRGRVVLINM